MSFFLSYFKTYSWIPPEAEEKVKSFKYKSIDKSYLYNYVLSPIAEYTIQFVPLSMA